MLCFAAIFFLVVAKLSGSEHLEGVALVMLFAAVMLITGADAIRRALNRKNPITEMGAVVVGGRSASTGRYGAIKKYYLQFAVGPDKARMEFEVPFREFDAHQVGDQGMLRYRTWEYISFSRK